MTQEKKKVKRIVNLDFKSALENGDLPHIALVDEGANEEEVLLMKAKDVQVSLSMSRFLEKFFGLWCCDAEALAKLLGYETESREDGYETSLEKDLKEVVFLKQKAIDKELPEAIPYDVNAKLEVLRKKLGSALDSVGASAGASLNDNKEENEMSKAEMSSAEAQIEEMRKAKEQLAVQIEEMRKQKEEAEAVVEQFRKQAAEKREKDLNAVLAGYTFINEELRKSLSSNLLSVSEEVQEIMCKSLEAARTAVEAVVVSEDSEATIEDTTEFKKSKVELYSDSLSKILANRKAK